MTILRRSDFIRHFLVSFLILLMFLGSISIVMGEDSSLVPNENLDVRFSEIRQLEIEIGEPVVMYQELTITNTDNESVNTSISLRDYIPDVYVDEYVSLVITNDASIVSVTSVLPVVLAPYQSKDYILEYEFVPVYKDIECEEKTIIDYLPSDATILPSTIPPETVIEKTCNVKIHHEGEIHYYNVEVTLEELEGEKINSIYYVEGDQYLKLINGVISLTR